ncbi:predicted protein [Chaetomium globosum CBS 148.51]|uniref:Uncharacterized protein n=1 Tax=Chaetomium globosum (strain ATCC 6205 / CBS 148.51 / DSM 1962 / NBRC 6347 / NRRL 1970) TaxID=306901 RepID=Q2GS49_CHAGB|nr:uncharacterized protein CHGG_09205 [Chaetomium globosum CBS 148.51]EAQ85191.1 predicted protein [Chaetomium globosum CBS 148.51]
MQKAVQRLQQRPARPFLGRQIPPPRWNPALRPPYGGTKPLPLSQPVPPMDLAQPAAFLDLAHRKESRSPAALEYPVYGPHTPEQEDTASEPPSEPSLAGDTASNSSVVFSEPAEMASAEENPRLGEKKPWHTGSEDGNNSRGAQPRQQQIERLRRMKKEADALFARNGDPSGLLAVLAEASLSNDNWDASGLPRF